MLCVPNQRLLDYYYRRMSKVHIVHRNNEDSNETCRHRGLEVQVLGASTLYQSDNPIIEGAPFLVKRTVVA